MRHFLFIALSLLGLIAMQEKVPQNRLADGIDFDFNERFPSFPSETISALSFGYPHLFSTLLWIRFLQETPIHKVPPGQFSWIYRDLDAILDIDPEFYPAVEQGGTFLSVITEDKIGAERLLLKGIRLFPDRPQPYFYLGYHYLYELNDTQKAAEIFRQGALKPGAVPLMALLATTLTIKTKGRDQGLLLLEDMLQRTTNPKIREKLLAKLAKLKEEEAHEHQSD
jgi:hypothetical protein